MKPKVLSCIQPSGELHIGNYFGAVKNWVSLQDSHECIYGIVDLHAITMPYKPAELRANTERMVIDLLACGIDPEKAILFIQSLVPEHAELSWILGCITPYGDLSRMTQFKDKSETLESAKSRFVSAGLFTYPVLQAADILIYRAGYVPVGKDQEQHLELSREIARRFNSQFGAQLFLEPAPLFTETPKITSLADPTKKMSKSGGDRHYIGLFEDEPGIRAKIKSAVTDSGQLASSADMSPGVANLLEILKACGNLEDAAALQKDYDLGKRQYSELKEATANALVTLTSRLRSRREEIAADAEGVKTRVKDMSEKARLIARETLKEVRRLTGLPERN
ncbi:MAG: tryptophanyl-tRNA synthetase [Blastocatellia bacterium]|jgi:tryptophanyl-tRNA synthetase|nr:tryptophanyl-tRNA synthetase [Blastocatellia bacterium]